MVFLGLGGKNQHAVLGDLLDPPLKVTFKAKKITYLETVEAGKGNGQP